MLTNDEQLALLEAMSKKIKPRLDDLKGEAKYALMDAYNQTGADRKAILVDGQKVGEVGMTYSSAKPVIAAGKEEEAIEYLSSLGLTEEVPAKGWESHFSKAGDNVVNNDTGELCDCLYWAPSMVKTAAVRGCKPDDVLEAFNGKLPAEDIMGLLEEGN